LEIRTPLLVERKKGKGRTTSRGIAGGGGTKNTTGPAKKKVRKKLGKTEKTDTMRKINKEKRENQEMGGQTQETPQKSDEKSRDQETVAERTVEPKPEIRKKGEWGNGIAKY